jgi:hypothetical protein
MCAMIRTLSLIVSVVVSASVISAAQADTPAVKHLAITDSSFNQRLVQALSLVKDPAVTIQAVANGPKHIALVSNGQSVSCIHGQQEDSAGYSHLVSECDFDLAVGISAEIDGPFATLMIQALEAYRTAQPSDDLVVQNTTSNGSMVELASTDPVQALLGASSIELASGTPPQAIVCHSILVSGGAAISACSFYLYQDLDPTSAKALLATLSAEPTYASVINADEAMIAAQGYSFSSLVAVQGLNGVTKLRSTYVKNPPHPMLGQILPSLGISIEANQSSSDPSSYTITGVYVGQ